jgi:glycosyltransferase involved in cell wall biosynthesis
MEDTNSPPPAVTVVIPTYNRPEALRRAVASALAQKRVTCEVIVVDDGSTPPVTKDDLPDEVRIVRNEGVGGVAAARNLGVERAQAPWVAFLDDDDWWAPEHLHLLREAASAAHADLAYAGTWDVDLGDGSAVMRPAPSPVGLDAQLLRQNVIGTPSCVMVSRSLHTAIGGFDTTLSSLADWDLWLRMADVGTAAASPAATVAYALHDANMSLDLTQLIADFGRLSERYALRCKRAGVRFGHPGFPRWIARLYRSEGLRGLAAAWYLRSSRVSGHRLDLLRALGVLLGERAMRSGAVFLGERPGARAKRRPPQTTRSVPFSWLSAHDAMLRPSASGQPPGRRS